MGTPDLYRTLARYNQWMNERLYDLCATLSEDERKHDMGAFFGSIHGTLNHILLGDRVWLGRITGPAFRVDSLRQELYADFPTLARERERTDAAIIRMATSLTPGDLEAPLTYRPMSGGPERSQALGLVLLHFFNHQTHHRGQITTLLSQLGHDPGVTDLIACPTASSPRPSDT